FGPQFRTVQGHDDGPPRGVALLLMSWSTLNALSGSAHAQKRRPLGLSELLVLGLNGMASLRPPISQIAMVLLVPSMTWLAARGGEPFSAQCRRGPAHAGFGTE